MSEPAIRLEGITKRFPGVLALEDVSFDVAAGSCHALCGENGAGKSTLGKILAGIYPVDAGRVIIFGGPVAFSGPEQALAAGVAIVHQELASQMHEKGNVAILAGNQNAPNLRKRVDGVQREAAKYPGMKIVDTFYHIETPQDAAAEVIRAQNAYPQIQGWAMIGGWALFTPTLLTDLDPKWIKIVSVDALPAELSYVDKGLAPVLLAQPTYLWGYISVQRIVEKVHLKQDVPQIIPMELVKVTKENLGTWARQLKDWGFTDVPESYLKMP